MTRSTGNQFIENFKALLNSELEVAGPKQDILNAFRELVSSSDETTNALIDAFELKFRELYNIHPNTPTGNKLMDVWIKMTEPDKIKLKRIVEYAKQMYA